MTKLSLSAFPDGATWIVEVRSVNDVGGYEQTLEGIPGASADEAIHWVIRHIREELANLGGSLVIEDETSESAGGDDEGTMRRRTSRAMNESEIARTTADVRSMAREHPDVIPRQIGQYVNLIVQGCKFKDEFLVDLGHVSLQGLGLELAELLVAQPKASESAGGDDERM